MGKHGVHRSTPSEQARLIPIIRTLWTRGYTTVQISEAIGIGPRTIREYLYKAGVNLGQEKKRNRSKLPQPDPIPWRDDEQPDIRLPSGYAMSLPARAVANSLRHLIQINGITRFAFDVTDAIAANDLTWVEDNRANLNELIDYLRKMAVLIDDGNARANTRNDINERDDLRPRLRQVGN